MAEDLKGTTSRRRGRPPVISREEVCAAALGLIDRGGVEALTMRGVAGELDVAPMSLYHHVADKNELIDAVIATVITDIAPDRVGEWQERCRSMAHELRRVGLEHSDVFRLMADRSQSAELGETVMEWYRDLQAVGVPPVIALKIVQSVLRFVVGSVLGELTGPMREAEPADNLELFDFGLTALLDGLQRYL